MVTGHRNHLDTQEYKIQKKSNLFLSWLKEGNVLEPLGGLILARGQNYQSIWKSDGS